MSPEVLRRAEEARAMLGQGSLFGEIWARLDAETVEAWRAAKTPEERERLYLKQSILAEVRAEALLAIESAAREEAREVQRDAPRPFRDFLNRLRRKQKFEEE